MNTVSQIAIPDSAGKKMKTKHIFNYQHEEDYEYMIIKNVFENQGRLKAAVLIENVWPLKTVT